MIIKIMEAENSYTYFGTTGELSVIKGNRSMFAGLENESTWIDPPDPDHRKGEYAKIMFVTDDGIKSIITPHRTYLINDSGKTIERLI